MRSYILLSSVVSFTFSLFAQGIEQKDHVFYPSEIWKDNTGRPINAHGGGILYHEGKYYCTTSTKDTYIAMFDKWNKTNLINLRYIWLPVIFKDGSIAIEWREKWELNEVFARQIEVKPNFYGSDDYFCYCLKK